MPGRIDRMAVYWGWAEIAQALGVDVRIAKRLWRRRGMPVQRDHVRPEGMLDEGEPARGRVYIGGQALHDWLNGRGPK